MVVCPKLVNDVRECLKKIKFFPEDTGAYCRSERYAECPFYRTLGRIGPCCDYIENCPIYAHFASREFDKFVKMTKDYCLSENMKCCKRYQIRKTGQTPPLPMAPNGDFVF